MIKLSDIVLNEREDSSKLDKYNETVDAIISKHKSNLKQAVSKEYTFTSQLELRNKIYSVSMDRFNVYFSNMKSPYKGEVKKSNGINTIFIYNEEYADQLSDLYYAILENKNKLKFYKNIKDLSEIDEIKSTLLHELVHIYDREKYDDTDKINSKLNKLINKNPNRDIEDIHHDLYSNRTTEYNAYFTQRVNSFLRTHGKIKDYSQFKEYMINIPIYKKMNDTLKKKYLNRVYSFYDKSIEQ